MESPLLRVERTLFRTELTTECGHARGFAIGDKWYVLGRHSVFEIDPSLRSDVAVVILDAVVAVQSVAALVGEVDMSGCRFSASAN